MDLPDGQRRHRLALVLLAPGAGAVVADTSPTGTRRRGHVVLAADDGPATLAHPDQSLNVQRRHRVMQRGQPQPVQVRYLTRRRELVARSQLARANRFPDLVGDLLPGRASARHDRQRREPNVLGQRPAGAGQVAAPAQPRVEGVQHRAADLADFDGAQRGQDRPPDVTLVRLPGGQVQLGDLHVPVEQLADRHPRVWSAPGCGVLQQSPEGDLSFLLGLDGLPVPKLATS